MIQLSVILFKCTVALQSAIHCIWKCVCHQETFVSNIITIFTTSTIVNFIQLSCQCVYTTLGFTSPHAGSETEQCTNTAAHNSIELCTHTKYDRLGLDHSGTIERHTNPHIHSLTHSHWKPGKQCDTARALIGFNFVYTRHNFCLLSTKWIYLIQAKTSALFAHLACTRVISWTIFVK